LRSFLPPFSVQHLKPVFCILTFIDAIDIIRHSPLEEVPAYVLGEGFVNSLLHAEVFSDLEEMLVRTQERIFACLSNEQYTICEQDYSGVRGYPLRNGFAITANCVYYRLFPVILTDREQRILQMILFAPEECFTLRQIEAYCYPYPYQDDVFAVANSIQAHISSINKKAAAATGRKFLKYSREKEGYVLYIRSAFQKRK